MNILLIIIGSLILINAGVLIYLTVKNNEKDPDTLEIILNSCAILIGIIMAILCFITSRNTKIKLKITRKKKFSSG